MFHKLSQKYKFHYWGILFVILGAWFMWSDSPSSSRIFAIKGFNVQSSQTINFFKPATLHLEKRARNNKQIDFLCYNLNILRDCLSVNAVENVNDTVSIIALAYSQRDWNLDQYKISQDFMGYFLSFGIRVIYVEGAYPQYNQEFLLENLTNVPGVEYIPVNLTYHMYQRENLLNFALRETKFEWEYMIWPDPHQIFLNEYWLEETLERMGKYDSI